MSILIIILAIAALVAIVAFVFLQTIAKPRRSSVEEDVSTSYEGIAVLAARDHSTLCRVCATETQFLVTLDFNKSCADLPTRVFPPAGVGVDYFLCPSCGFAFAPAFSVWEQVDFERWIYNSEYERVDPDYVVMRPAISEAQLEQIFGAYKSAIKHLDYGGGNGELSRRLTLQGWNSVSYDPFADASLDLASLGQFDLITLIEVIEHVPDPQDLMRKLKGLLRDDGIVVISTVLIDGNLEPGPLDWSYASPRNGHISLFSFKSLSTLAGQYGLSHYSFDNLHAFVGAPPKWAPGMFGPA